MKKSKINIEVTLDEQNVPELIEWQATDSPAIGFHPVKAMALALWDDHEKGTLKIDLWTKDMEVHEMKRFFIETMSGMADTIRNATYDEIMAIEIENLCQQLTTRLEQELRLNESSK
ncbi:MAG: gliding motility protein GldC [Microscillaceae bacterium]|jgi:gliding motility-associated protein GldC|nr:gliding motility protein GldC [Microscillaceae bacterium]